MDAQYQSAYQQAVQLQNKFRNLIDQPNSPSANKLRDEIQCVVDDLKTKRNPRDVENRTKAIQQYLNQSRSSGEQMMSSEHVDLLWHGYEQMKMSLRHFDNY